MMKPRNNVYMRNLTEILRDGSTRLSPRGGTADMFTCSPGGKHDFVHPTAHSFVKELTIGVKGSQYYDWFPGGPKDVMGYSGVWGQRTTHAVNDAAAIDTAYNAALSDLFESLRGGADLAMDLVFRKDTERLLKDARDLFTHYGPEDRAKIKDKKFRQRLLRNPLKAVGSGWLIYRFGIMPTYKSISESINTILGKVEANIQFTGRGKVRTEEYFLDSTDVVPWGVRRWRSNRCLISVHVKPEMSRMQFLSGVTSFNPIFWAYDAVPYSWLVDYFYNLGGFMRNLETAILHGNRFVDGYRTDSFSCEVQQTQKGRNPAYGTFDRAQTTQRRSMERQVLTSMPFPRPPRLDLDLGSGQLLNLAGLLATKLPTRHAKPRG